MHNYILYIVLSKTDYRYSCMGKGWKRLKWIIQDYRGIDGIKGLDG